MSKVHCSCIAHRFVQCRRGAASICRSYRRRPFFTAHIQTICTTLFKLLILLFPPGDVFSFRLFQAFQSIICEWLLSTRAGLWQATYCYDDVTRVAPLTQLSAFDSDIHLLRMIAEEMPAVACKVSCTRLISGVIIQSFKWICPSLTRFMFIVSRTLLTMQLES